VSGLAVLPMYDWPQVAAATDRMWAAIRDALRAEGVDAPERLTRDVPLMAAWTDPALVLGQTCGLPLVRALADRVAVIGAGDYGVPGCAPGWYRSAIVVRARDPRGELGAFRGACLAVNGFESQSGWGSVLHHAAALAPGHHFFGAVRVSGAHVRSVAMVAAGEADLAAIDFVSWRLALRHLPAASALRVLRLTDPTPGLAFIAAAGADRTRLSRALTTGIAQLDSAARRALGIAGFAPLRAEDYRVIADRLARAEALLPGEAARAREATPA
jgi:ABC-type phosphate/phosphonate transport system substrate-binding protein